MERKDMPLELVILLDKIQKKQTLTQFAINTLKKEKLIEGRKPNYFIAASVAEIANDKASYIKNKAFDKEYYKNLIIVFIKQYKSKS